MAVISSSKKVFEAKMRNAVAKDSFCKGVAKFLEVGAPEVCGKLRDEAFKKFARRITGDEWATPYKLAMTIGKE